LEEFSYVASHDLQEPLRTIASYSKLLKDDLGDELNEDAAEDIHFIIDAADRMRSMVQDLLELSRAGRSVLKSQIVDLNDCMDQVKHDLKVRLEETGGSIESRDLPTVEGDSSQLTRVLLNLVGNGLKFHGDEAPHVDISACKMDDDWRISVSDNGIGIPEQYQDQIFAPFKRLHGTTQYSGTGIGLAVVRKVVERHGGQVSIESTPGVGTSIAFTLPEISMTEEISDVEIKNFV
jgi:light-regulated signal transduction histidine kinase (bacteriophytochrome)